MTLIKAVGVVLGAVCARLAAVNAQDLPLKSIIKQTDRATCQLWRVIQPDHLRFKAVRRSSAYFHSHNWHRRSLA